MERKDLRVRRVPFLSACKKTRTRTGVISRLPARMWTILIIYDERLCAGLDATTQLRWSRTHRLISAPGPPMSCGRSSLAMTDLKGIDV